MIGDAIAAAIVDVTGSSWRFKIAEELTPNTVAEQAEWYRFSFEGSLEGEAFLAIPEAASESFGLRAKIAGGDDEKIRGGSELLEVLRGCTPKLETLLAEYGAVLVTIEPAESPDMADASEFQFAVESDDGKSQLTCSLHLGRALASGFQALTARSFVFPPATGGNTSNLELVLDVALNVTLRFGQRRLALREVLELSGGSVVELDRQVDEPVELVLDGKVVARGEAVIIDGNYGIRVTQVVQPIEV
jgi:flagellar motor switch protein FliN/FliY